MTLLGLNAYHADAAACLIKDGHLVAAAEEERFRRIKHWAGLPTQAIDYCLREGGVSLGDIEHIAVNRKPGVNNLRRLAFVLTHWPDPRLMLQKVRNIRSAAGVKEALEKAYGVSLDDAQIHHVEHHLAHLASAFLVSGFDEAACISIDGFGDFASTAMGWGSSSEITIDQRVYFPHSLGILYSAITQFIGFPNYGDEYKVMGLAPYGEAKYVRHMRELVRIQADGTFRLNLRYFRHHRDNVSYSWNDCAPEVGPLYSWAISDLLGSPRKPDEPLEQKHKDIARSVQAIYEETLFALLNALHARRPSDNLALSGGCAMNSVANGKVYLRTPFKKMYLPAAAGDAGGAIGAAAVVQAQLTEARSQKSAVSIPRSPPPPRTSYAVASALRAPQSCASSTAKLKIEVRKENNPRSALRDPHCPPPSTLAFLLPTLFSPYLGPEFSESEIETLLGSRGLLARKGDSAIRDSPSAFPSADLSVTRITNNRELTSSAATAIAAGRVVGWFQGRMEWGPRALGNRSILCDPRRADMKELLNAKIKRRESFRPFAPSILREAVSEWFEQDRDVPYMMQVYQILPARRSQLPAVCHVDGSGRLQTVHRETNPLYHQLISAFCSLTSVPLVLNTSFNENEPIVCRPEEALDSFLRTQMDVLVLGSFYIERATNAQNARSVSEPSTLDFPLSTSSQ